MGPNYNHKGPHKGETKGQSDLTQKRKRTCDHRARDWRDTAIHQGMHQQPPEAGRGKEQLYPGASRGNQLCRHLDLRAFELATPGIPHSAGP